MFELFLLEGRAIEEDHCSLKHSPTRAHFPATHGQTNEPVPDRSIRRHADPIPDSIARSKPCIAPQDHPDAPAVVEPPLE